MRRFFELFTVLACLLSVACSASSTISFRILDRGVAAAGPYASQRFRIIAEATDFKDTFQALHATELPRPTPPEVDFGKSIVLIVAIGKQPSTGYEVDVEQIQRQGDVLNVRLRLSKPSSESVQATMVTSPFLVVEMDKQPGWKTAKFFDQDQNLLASLNASN